MFEMRFPSPMTRQYVEQMKKAGILSHCWNLQPVAPTKQDVQHMKEDDMWDSIYQAIYSTFEQFEQCWHVEARFTVRNTKHSIEHRPT